MIANVTLIFFLLLIPLSGFIAWAGDRIGHKSGKKRHSIFGLRPRHTAMFFTIGAGMSISIASFALMYAVSESFRVVINDGAALTEKNRELKTDNALLEQQAAQSHHSAFLSDRERQAADTARDAARREQARAEQLTKKAQQLAKDAQRRLSAETSELNHARNDLQNAGIALAKVQSGLRVKNSQLETAKQRVGEAERHVAAAETRQKGAEAQAKSADEYALRVRNSAEQAVALQTKNLDTLRGQLQAQTVAYNEQKNTQRTELDRLTQELERRRKDLEQTTASAAAMRRRQITYQVGEEVARVQINKGITSWRAQGILDSFLTTTAKKAEERGAGRGNEVRAVVILPQSISPGPLSSGGSATVFNEDDRIRAAADAILQSKTDVVVVAIATANAVAGEPVPVDFKMYRNPLVYAANATIGETTVNGTVSRQEIADSLYGFLLRDIRRNLLHAGIIPLGRGGDSVETSVGFTDGGNVAALTGEEWLQVIENVRDAGAKAHVVVRASKALRAGDSVALRFEVRGQRSAMRN